MSFKFSLVKIRNSFFIISVIYFLVSAIEIVGDIAKEQKLDLVANRSNVLVFRNQLDLTKIVLGRLNERTKDARFEVKEVTSSKTTQ